MKSIREVPVPFLIVIAAGLVSVFSLIATSRTRPTVTNHDSVQVQTVEQEHIAAIYFRVLSWLSDVTPQPVEAAGKSTKAASAPYRQNALQHTRTLKLCGYRIRQTWPVKRLLICNFN